MNQLDGYNVLFGFGVSEYKVFATDSAFENIECVTFRPDQRFNHDHVYQRSFANSLYRFCNVGHELNEIN